MLKNLLKLRINQFARLVQTTGIGIVIVLFFATLGFTLSVLQYLSSITPLLFFGIAMILLLSVHFKRNDLHFLQSIAPTTSHYRLCLFVEYFILLIPFLIFFVCFQKWVVMIPIVVAPSIVAMLPSIILIKKSDTKFSIAILPSECFEIKSHIEKNSLAYGLLAIIGLFSAFHISLFILFSVLLGANIFSAFNQLEPKELIHANQSFLIEKIKRNIRLVLFMTFPFFSIALLFQFKLSYVVLYFYFTIFLAITLGILFKDAYANPLNPYSKTSTAQSIFFILPYLPGLIIANIGYQLLLWSKATKNLERYYA